MSDGANRPTMAEVFRNQACRRGEAPAQVFRDRTTTYAGLDRHANQVAHGLIAAGLRPRTRIGYLGKNRATYFSHRTDFS